MSETKTTKAGTTTNRLQRFYADMFGSTVERDAVDGDFRQQTWTRSRKSETASLL